MILDGEVALVTGASRGIGQAIARELASLGATVIGTATTSEGAARISANLIDAGLKGEGAILEVRDAAQVDELIRHIEKTYGAVSVLVNNAGITRDNLSMRLKDDEWDAVIETNLKAVFRLCKAVMRGMMKARRGRIINVTSVVGHAGNPGQANYCAAKAGVAGMSRALARELGSRNVTVNCVAPGLIDTDMTRGLDEQQKESLLGSIPLGRLGSPQDVAAAVAFLASPGGGYVTGTTIHVNGGMFVG
ncbi:MAG: 3-oxoacyl-ACP reductase FabG [Candidatus Accumulibacter sp.]|uniref:3-oxoacyl-ACP reductase FabG n=1 Tax=Accumulibacter sp. TaxID=2053492 RepID=UPI0019FC1980|nr:3-oxoacyl-ACP reductase FabG [Accumulibacter sp.]MBE2259430.1 3-oxoacyl-ACP reductase FabG [Paracoccaceae bacterium]MCB1941296.1 3-oxoacyl-ACP reductase FabG [Accumulibacter sp.]MCP5248530.1 3-oxoacyl-ACP reductase FabG [Accumulibacter sp.]